MSQIINQIGNFSLTPEQFFADLRATTRAQFRECAAYRALCDRQEFDPDRDLQRPGDEVKIPWITSNSFKKSHQLYARLLREQASAIEIWTTSSGTSGDPSIVGRATAEMAAYRAAYRAAFAHAAGRERWDLSLLFWPDPDPILARSESMMNGKVQPYGLHIAHEAGLTHDPKARRFVAQFDPRTRSFSIDSEAIIEDLRRADGERRAVFLGGSPILIYQALYRYARERGCSFAFRERCQVQFGAGGWSGRKGSIQMQEPIPKHEFIPGLCDLLGIHTLRSVNDMWGSTETSFAMPAHFSEGRKDFLFHALPWARIILRDPQTLEPVERPGERGLLEVVTPYGVDSYAGVAILVDDVLELVEAKEGPGCQLADHWYQFIGRAQGAEAKGCGVLAADWVEGGWSGSDGRP